MKTPQNETEFNELINAAGINQAIETLEQLIACYKRFDSVGENRYAVQRELDSFMKELVKIKESLNHLIEQSVQWEALH